jgi:beta-N-acetylhexosaminidase
MLMIGIAGTDLAARERAWLTHHAVCGVILFTRNFIDAEQVTRLVAELRAASPRPLLIAVDQEGGPVQRFRPGFTALPPLMRIGEVWSSAPARAVALAEEHAWVMASEMRALDIDLSFAPVADLGRGNRAIGIRAFHADPLVVSELTQAYVRGMHLAGMAATLKHFPGHGSVLEDTHVDVAVDARELDAMRDLDLLPFRDAIAMGADAVMMAHVVYPNVDVQPAGYSRRWIVDILRGELGFRGMVFSDDIGMAAAFSAGGVAARIAAHRDAGCDVVLACHPDLVEDCLRACDELPGLPDDLVIALQGRVAQSWASLRGNVQRANFVARLEALHRTEQGQA